MEDNLMSETVNQDASNEVKTFTQEELNAIVSDRLNRERQKYEGFEDYKAKAAKLDELEEASKTELQKATERANALEAELNTMKKASEIRAIRDNVASKTGVPASMLTFDTEDECTAQANEILNFRKPAGYPTVKDGGEVSHVGGTTTRDQFAEWANEAFN